jgi:hypothetical protein
VTTHAYFHFVGLNALFVVAGAGMLAPFVRLARTRDLVSISGVAFVTGTSLSLTMLSLLTLVGVHPTADWCIAVTFALGAAGLVVHARRRRADELARARSTGFAAIAVSAFAAAGLAVVSALLIVAAFRSSPWLDDTWFRWLPRGLQVQRLGADAHVLAAGHGYYGYAEGSYPLWWSILIALSVGTTGSVNLHAVCGELALFSIATVVAVARMLWGRVDPALLWPSLLLLVAAPQFENQTQSGGADLVVAGYVALFVVAAWLWVEERRPLWVALAFVFGVGAVQVKKEGISHIVLCAVVLTVYAWLHDRRSATALGALSAGALVTIVPWRAWAAAHGASDRFGYSGATHPVALFHKLHRIDGAASDLGHRLADPRQWLLLVPVACALSVVAAIRRRHVGWLAPSLLLALEFAFLVGVYWVGPFELSSWLATSADRAVDPMPLIAGVALAPLAQAALARPRADETSLSTQPQLS